MRLKAENLVEIILGIVAVATLAFVGILIVSDIYENVPKQEYNCENISLDDLARMTQAQREEYKGKDFCFYGVVYDVRKWVSKIFWQEYSVELLMNNTTMVFVHTADNSVKELRRGDKVFVRAVYSYSLIDGTPVLKKGKITKV